jgi:hypothetical protein
LCFDGSNDADPDKVGQFAQDKLIPAAKLGRDVAERKDFYGMGNGVYKNGPDGPHAGKQNVALIKPYIVSKYADPEDKTRYVP